MRRTARVELSPRVVALGLIAVAATAGPAPRPNVVFILADDLGFSDLGCYGGEIATPNLDALARDGLRFTQCYNSARCWPSRAALLTGYYPQQVRRDNMPGVAGGARPSDRRPAWAPLLSELLRPVGYRSYHSGKWHIDSDPNACGFDRAYLLQDGDRHLRPQTHSLDGRPLPPVQESSHTCASTLIASYAVEFLKEHARSYAERPFFAYVCFLAPHFPLQAWPQDIQIYRHRYTNGWSALQAERGRRLRELGIVQHDPPPMEEHVGPPYHFPDALERLGPGETNRPVPWERLTPQQREFQAAKMAIHAAMVHRMDLEIGRILEQLRAMNAWSNTLIFFATDNGASAEIMVRGDGHDPTAPMGSANSYLCLGPGFSSACNTPFRRHKSWVHEGGIATPLIVHWPAGIPPSARGSLRRAVTHFIDFVPTVLELAGVERPTTIQGAPVPPLPGQSWVPLITGEDRAWHRVLWWYHEGNRAVRLGDWKLVAGHDSPKPKDPMPGSWELYDLSRDRSETRNLAAEMPDRVRELAALWEQMAEEIRALANRDPLPDTEPGGTSAPPRVRVKSGEKPAAQPASPQQVPTPN